MAPKAKAKAAAAVVPKAGGAAGADAVCVQLADVDKSVNEHYYVRLQTAIAEIRDFWPDIETAAASTKGGQESWGWGL